MLKMEEKHGKTLLQTLKTAQKSNITPKRIDLLRLLCQKESNKRAYTSLEQLKKCENEEFYRVNTNLAACRDYEELLS